MRKFLWAALALATWSTAALGQVCPATPLDLTGSTRVMDGKSLFAMNWRTRQGLQPSIMTPQTLWSPGLSNGWSTNQDGTGPVYISAINPGSEDQVYLTFEGWKKFGDSLLAMKSDGPNGPLRIHPRKLTATEKTQLITRGDLGPHNWISGAVTTSPQGLAPPAYFEVEFTLPAGAKGSLSGLWPAFWQMATDGSWPPEVDSMEMFGGPISASLHTTDQTWLAKVQAAFKKNGIALSYGAEGGSGSDYGAVASQWLTTGADMQGKHRYGTLLTADGIYHYFDRHCVISYAMPSDLKSAPLFMLINLAVGTPGSGPGNPPAGATDIGELVVSDVWAGTYGKGSDNPPPPPPPPVLTTNLSVDTSIPATVSGTFTLAGAAGTQWVNVGLFSAAGANLGVDTKPVNGKWTMFVDTTKLTVGKNNLQVNAFSVPSGQPGGTSAAISLTLNVVRTVPPPPPPPVLTPIQKTVAALKADIAKAVADAASPAKVRADMAQAQADLDALVKLLP